VQELIAKLDTATRQVLIEAHLVETARNPSTIKGIDWSGTLAAQNLSFGNNVGLPDGSPDLANGNKLLVGSSPASKLLIDTAKGFNPATAFLDADGVNAVLSFLNTDTESEVVATPRAVTLDNQTANLSVTRAFPIFKVTPGSANSPAGAEITYTNVGTILQVTPRITADDTVALRVVPEVSNIDGRDQQVVNGEANTANIYAIRRIETQVLIPSGNTLVMGGLISSSENNGFTKVPILGDIPGAGRLFRSSSKKQNKSNLLIFVTPTIVEEEAFVESARGREFLKNRLVEKKEKAWSAYDSAKPHDWSKPSSR
jgi:type II secretory pathway component GspD/PulD (secretin)